jgi:hypothetical protein
VWQSIATLVVGSGHRSRGSKKTLLNVAGSSASIRYQPSGASNCYELEQLLRTVDKLPGRVRHGVRRIIP